MNSTRSPVSGLDASAGPGSPPQSSVLANGSLPIAPPPPEDYTLSSLSPTLPQLSSLTLPLASYGAPTDTDIHFCTLSGNAHLDLQTGILERCVREARKSKECSGRNQEPGRGSKISHCIHVMLILNPCGLLPVREKLSWKESSLPQVGLFGGIMD